MTRINRVKREVIRYIFLFIGSIIAAVGLEIFLVPNNIIDGGVIGISIIASYLTGVPLSVYIIVLNLPFLIFGYKQIGKTFVFSSLFAIISLSFWVSVFHPIPGLTNDILLAAVFGGIVLGIGVGLIIRNSGSLDGTEMVAIVFNKRTSFSVGEIVMFFNLFILSSAGLVFGWDRAMYSLLAYFIAFKVIDVTIEGLNEEKAAIIVSDNSYEIAEAILARLGRGVTFLEGKGGFSKEPKTIIYSVITRLEIAKLKAIVYEIDENAFLTINDVFDVMGGKQKKRAIH
ncbi:YitT family protein [Acetobacterium sp.]|uniref:YitT family protein n=1 Tax=Acetobacterium sp. TaxID=1872094 RepID=UPI002F40124C